MDLSRRTSWVETLPEDVVRRFIGGSGVAAWLFSTMASQGGAAAGELSPFDPANPLIFAVGPLCGTSAPTSGRHEVAALSPLTGIYAESDVGGAWGSSFRATGFDFLVIKAAADRPSALVIGPEGARIEDAAAIWGADSFETSDHYGAKYPGSETACIGPAGENLAPIACIVHDGRDARMAGRCGLGAVMGSKKLKAVVAAPGPGPRRPRRIHNPEAFAASAREMARKNPVNAEGMAKFGTAGSLGAFYDAGDVPVKNWLLGAAALDIPGISGQRMAETGLLEKRFFCTMCPIGCGRVIRLSDGRLGGGPEYETICLFGTNCMIDNMETICLANEKANRLGLDSISAGSAVGFLMEAYERNEIRGQDLSGVEPLWGSSQALLRLLDLMAAREGIGDILCQGVAKASQRIGSPEYAIHVKGLELPAHDPRAFNSTGLSYATANRGACHLQSLSYNFERRLTLPEKGFDLPQDRFGTERKAELVVATQNFMSLMDSLKLCKFAIGGGTSATTALSWLNLATGWDMDLDEFFLAGERIYNLKRLYNTRRGISRKDDTLPGRILKEIKGGGAKDNLPPDLDASLDEYYVLRGWTSDGIPGAEKLAQLGLQGL
ncbi:MAG: aldehyde:ferredoxin oxidoreductase [Spirochaetes bacterium]|nr:MAG: aldehyde:ferredoxin oxidoreductase [Spirochaetota bacterium]